MTEAILEPKPLNLIEESDRNVIGIIDRIIHEAYEASASDIHVHPSESEIVVPYGM